MNNFQTLKSRLEVDGWFVGWALGCSQIDGWIYIPTEFPETHPLSGKIIDIDKVLFNHGQDCENFVEEEEFPPEMPEGLSDEDQKKWYCEVFDKWLDDCSAQRRILECDEMYSSLFCFSNSKIGLKKLIGILPHIDECGCRWDWNKKSDTRILISWR